jgi:hypothetical protein
MIFDQSLDLGKLPQLMREAFRIAPLGLWQRRAEVLLEQERAHTFLKEYFDREFAIERNLDRVRRYHKATGRYPNLDAGNYELFSFLAILYLTYSQLSTSARERLKGSIRDGLTDDKGVAPVASELRTASNLMGQGFDVDFMDLEGLARYDFLASKGELTVEVDCKAPSGDVGRQIHERRFLRFASDLRPNLRDLAATGGGHLVHVTIPRNFHGDSAFEGRLVRQTSEAIRSVIIGEQIDEEVEISIRPFDLTKTDSGPGGPSKDDSEQHTSSATPGMMRERKWVKSSVRPSLRLHEASVGCVMGRIRRCDCDGGNGGWQRHQAASRAPGAPPPWRHLWRLNSLGRAHRLPRQRARLRGRCCETPRRS